MRVLECNLCGETLSAANDEELTGLVAEHVASEHAGEDIGDPGELVAKQAYDATDS